MRGVETELLRRERRKGRRRRRVDVGVAQREDFARVDASWERAGVFGQRRERGGVW